MRALGQPGVPLLIDAIAARADLRWDVEGRADQGTVQELGEAFALAQRHLGPGNERTLRVASALASYKSLLSVDGRGAIQMLEQSIGSAVADGRLAPSHPVMIQAQVTLGRLMCAQGRKDEGLALAERQLAVAKEAHGLRSRVYIEALSDQAFAQYCSGRSADSVRSGASAYRLAAAREPFAGAARIAYGRRLAGYLIAADLPELAEPLLDEAFIAVRATSDPHERRLRLQRLEMVRVGLLYRFGEYALAREVLTTLGKQAAEDSNPVLAEAVARASSGLPTAERSKETREAIRREHPRLGAPDATPEQRLELALARLPVLPDVAEILTATHKAGAPVSPAL